MKIKFVNEIPRMGIGEVAEPKAKLKKSLNYGRKFN